MCVPNDIKYISSYGYQFLKLESLNASALYGNRYLSVDMASPKPNELKDRVCLSDSSDILTSSFCMTIKYMVCFY